MMTYKDVTKEQLDAMAMHHRKIDYNPDEAAEVINLVKTFIDPHQQSCMGCGNNLRDAKTKLNEFYLFYKDAIQENLDAAQNVSQEPAALPSALDEAEKQVEAYSAPKKRTTNKKK